MNKSDVQLSIFRFHGIMIFFSLPLKYLQMNELKITNDIQQNQILLKFSESFFPT